MGYIQSGLQVLTRSLCQVEALVDKESNPLIDLNGKPQFKTANFRVELSYTYLMTWYVMHFPSLMTAVSALESFVPFVQRLENSNWIHYYMFSSEKPF